MTSEEQVLFGFFALFFSISLVVLLLVILDILSRYLNSRNTKKNAALKEKHSAIEAKNLTKIEDYDVEFNINLKNSIVRTEVVYTE